MASYNKYYKEENYFGKPYPELINLFSNWDRNNKVLDLGCGQGRDSLELGRLGFSVTGIDISKVGIDQLNEVAKKENLDVKGLVGDYQNMDIISDFDIVLMDSMFHFYKSDLKKETEVLIKIATNLKRSGKLVIIVQESEFRIKHINEIYNKLPFKVSILFEDSFIYKEFDSRFYMIGIEKLV